MDDRDDEGVEKTITGGWWQPGMLKQPEKRQHPRVPYAAWLELVPSDGKRRYCETVNVSLGGVLLRQTDTAEPLLDIGQMVEVVFVSGSDEQVVMDGEVVRHAEDERFALRFTNLDDAQREYLRDVEEKAAEGAEEPDADESEERPDGSYSEVLKKP